MFSLYFSPPSNIRNVKAVLHKEFAHALGYLVNPSDGGKNEDGLDSEILTGAGSGSSESRRMAFYENIVPEFSPQEELLGALERRRGSKRGGRFDDHDFINSIATNVTQR